MSWLRKKLLELQRKPYQVRLRILRWSVIGTALILILIWLLTLKLDRAKPSEGPSNFAPLLENFQKLKELKWR